MVQHLWHQFEKGRPFIRLWRLRFDVRISNDGKMRMGRSDIEDGDDYSWDEGL